MNFLCTEIQQQKQRRTKEVMHEEMSRKEDTEERWGSIDQDIALKLRELSVDTAGGW